MAVFRLALCGVGGGRRSGRKVVSTASICNERPERDVYALKEKVPLCLKILMAYLTTLRARTILLYWVPLVLLTLCPLYGESTLVIKVNSLI